MFSRSTFVSRQHQVVMLAASLFLLCNVFIHLMSPSITYEITPDQTVFNLSGRQRMLILRMTRTLSEIQASFTLSQVSSAYEQNFVPQK